MTSICLTTSSITIAYGLSVFTAAPARANIREITERSDRYKLESSEEVTEKITQVDRLRDVAPTDWAYEALRSLVKRYNCSVSLTDLTNRETISRYEFAADLNSCLIQIESSIGSAAVMNREDLKAIERLSQDFVRELSILKNEVANLQLRNDSIIERQFSTTTKLYGEVVFGLAGVFAGYQENGRSNLNRTIVLGDTLNLELDTSFTGEDVLAIELEAANFPDFDEATDTFQGKLSFAGSNDNNFELDVLAYELGNLEVIIGVAGLAADDIAETINFFENDNGGGGAISNFGGLNPIYETAEDAGLGITYELGEIMQISAGYLASPANEPLEEGRW